MLRISELAILYLTRIQKKRRQANFNKMAKKEKIKERELINEEIVKSTLHSEHVITDISDKSRQLYEQSRYGVLLEEGKLQLALVEALYLIEKRKLEVFLGKKKIDIQDFIKKAKKKEPNFWIRYCVYKNIRERGYIIKTALKFGADFRVYERGVKPGEDHAKWIVYPVHEGSTSTWYEFAAKNRVAHSTKKRLLIAIVDGENDVTYYEVKWVRP